MSAELLLEHAFADDDGVLQVEHGLFQTTANEGGPCYLKNQYGEYRINYDSMKYIKGTFAKCY